MNNLIILNCVIFAALFSLLMIELGSALISLLDTGLYKKKVIVYLAPLWEITGTIAVFYLVNLVATYPGLLTTIDYLYITPILMAAVFLIARDAYLAYSELSMEKKDNKKHARVYGTLTLLTMFLLVTVLSSSVSGGGVNPFFLSVNLAGLLINGFNILMLGAVIVIAYASAIVLFNLKCPKTLGIIILLSILLLITALKNYVPYILANATHNPIYVAPVIILFLSMVIMYLRRSRYTKFLVIPLLFLGTLTFELLEYPYLFGAALNVNSFTAPQPTAFYVFLITIFGGMFLAIALAFFFYIHHSKKGGYR
jgi:cytochrome bd-type quinol oxidase subunit 2